MKVKNLMDLYVPVESSFEFEPTSCTELSYEEYIPAKYVGRSSCGFKHNHKYLVKMLQKESGSYGITVHAIKDDNGNDIDIQIRFSNISSANTFFKI